jgi:hypothetical protein
MAESGDFEEMLDALDSRIMAALVPAVAKALEHVRGESVKLAPVESGNLAGSAGVTVFEAVGGGASVTGQLLYPGPYARNQHYSLDFRHTHGQALYLEQPMITEAGKAIKIISDEIGKVF